MAARLRKSRKRKGRNKEPELVFPTRLRPGQLHLIAKVKKFRSDANELRTQVSAGYYGGAELGRFYRLAK